MIRLAAVLSAFALVGCTDNYTVLMLRNIEPSATCEVSPSTNVSIVSGFLDVTPVLPNGQGNPGYLLTPELRNPTLAPAVGATRPGNPNAHIFFLQGVDIQILAGPNPASETAVTALQAANLANRTVRLSSAIEPGGAIAIGYQAIDGTMVQALQGAVTTPAQVIVRNIAFGEIDGTRIESLPFDYPITLCDGCLLLNLGPCATLSMDAEVPTGGDCSPLQDGNLGCCTTDGLAVCPAVSTATP